MEEGGRRGGTGELEIQWSEVEKSFHLNETIIRVYFEKKTVFLFFIAMYPTGGGGRDLDRNIDNTSFLINPLHDSGDNLTGSELKALLKAPLQDACHGVLPKDGVRYLSGENLLDDLWVRVRLGVNVGNDRNPGLLDVNVLENIGELW